MNKILLRFQEGTLEVHGLPETTTLMCCVWDPRTHCHRAEAIDYATVVMSLRQQDVTYTDEARAYPELETGLVIHRKPRPYQQEALDEWWKHRGRGLVVLPTGAGKSHVAMMAIDKCRRGALIVAPTLDLVRQWYDLLRTSFRKPVGVVGGGEHQIEALTVTTYDSAYIHMERLGARFGLVVFDECHHLPSDAYSLAARQCLAPFRMGLSATPERTDGRNADYERLIGATVYRKDIIEMSGQYLSDYETVRIEVELSKEEREVYAEARQVYLSFLRSQGIQMGQPRGWGEFIKRSTWSDEGRAAMKAYRKQRQLAFAAPAKLEYLANLLHTHRHDRSLVFTQDNHTAYAISRRFLIPVITHQTKIFERSQILDRLKEGVYRAVVTSRVLNEGVDVPSANVAIIVSGSGSVREHVQRLGRVLRKQKNKSARLYELITAQTSEQYTSERRREHSAYR